ncbi:hypothetical protein CRG98_044323 [Punica granatum]|uniref:Protein kinase domain-containing protein n=1 Tax=Punica granatum TaxID=22663 RepID=A0A2I0HUC2_PUNGR|nr:hypothetical protein CRG98_044323 [Punica granatum]
MPNESLDNFLFINKGKLEWDVRHRIVLEIVSTLHYIHKDVGQCALHKDIKAANVLLNKDFSTKLGDFGVAKLLDPFLRSQKMGVVGTLGFLAPKYQNEGRWVWQLYMGGAILQAADEKLQRKFNKKEMEARPTSGHHLPKLTATM